MRMRRLVRYFVFPALVVGVIFGPALAVPRAGSPITPPTPFPLPSFRPASMPTSLPYPAYGTPVPGVVSTAREPGISQVVTLDQAVRIGFARSPLLLSARANEALAHAGVRLQQAGLLPLISGSASTGRIIGKAQSFQGGVLGTTFTSNGLSASLSQLVYDGGKVAAEIHAAKHSEVAQIDTYHRTLQDVAFNVAQAYYNSLAAQRTTAVDVELVAQNLLQQDLVAAQVRAGTAAKADIATAEFPVAQARLAVVQAQGAELAAQAAFANAMGLPADTAVLPFDDTPIFTRAAAGTSIEVPGYAQAIARALALRPDYDAVRQTMYSSQASFLAAKRGFFPSLSGTANTGTTSSNPQGGAFRPSSNLGLQLSIPIFNQGINQADVAQAQATYDYSQAQFATAEEGLQLNVKQTLAGFVSARAAVDQADAEYTEALVVLQSTQAQYRAGVTTLPLLLNAEVGLTTALTDQVKTIYSLREAEQAFLYAEGENDLQHYRFSGSAR